MTNRKTQKMILVSQDALMKEPYYRRLWMATVSLSIPRRLWLDQLADTFRDFEGIILTSEGSAIQGTVYLINPPKQLKWIFGGSVKTDLLHLKWTLI